MTTSPIAALEEALSLERFGRYLAWSGGDPQKATDLYTLNAKLSESLYIPLQMLEVELRNRIHAVASVAAGERWFDNPDYQRGSRQTEQLAKAKQDLVDDGKEPAPGRIVAALTFGYWTAFFGTNYEDPWRKTLNRIARRPDGKLLARKNFARPLTPIRHLRNRIAHHEPILSWNLPRHHANMADLTEWLSPAAAEWCRAHCRFAAVWPADGVKLAQLADLDRAM